MEFSMRNLLSNPGSKDSYEKMLTKMGLRATIQLLDAICQPHVRKALVKGTTRKYFCLSSGAI